MEERCVICGEVIPEGRQVCPKCERRRWEDEHDQGGGPDREVSESADG